MSQSGILNIAGGGGGGSPIMTLTGDSGGAVSPTANNVFIRGLDSIENNANGITVIGIPGTSTLNPTLTNRITGSVTTTDAVTTQLLSFPYNTNTGPGTYLFDFKVTAYNLTDNLSSGYNLVVCVRFSGGVGVLVTPYDSIIIEEGTMINADVFFDVTTGSIVGNVNGLAGKTIHWLAVGTYIFVS